MTGWKTLTGGIAVILTGIATAIEGFNKGDWNQVAAGIALAGGGLTAIGVAHKIEKTGTKPTETPPTQ